MPSAGLLDGWRTHASPVNGAMPPSPEIGANAPSFSILRKKQRGPEGWTNFEARQRPPLWTPPDPTAPWGPCGCYPRAPRGGDPLRVPAFVCGARRGRLAAAALCMGLRCWTDEVYQYFAKQEGLLPSLCIRRSAGGDRKAWQTASVPCSRPQTRNLCVPFPASRCTLRAPGLLLTWRTHAIPEKGSKTPP